MNILNTDVLKRIIGMAFGEPMQGVRLWIHKAYCVNKQWYWAAHGLVVDDARAFLQATAGEHPIIPMLSPGWTETPQLSWTAFAPRFRVHMSTIVRPGGLGHLAPLPSDSDYIRQLTIRIDGQYTSWYVGAGGHWMANKTSKGGVLWFSWMIDRAVFRTHAETVTMFIPELAGLFICEDLSGHTECMTWTAPFAK